MSEKSEFNEFIDRIKNKLDNNPNLKEEVESNIDRLCEIFETDVNINLEYYPDIENYQEIFNNYDISEIENESIDSINSDFELPIKLSEFKEMLDEEEEDLKLCIDPLYLKGGINDINNVLITTLNDRIILIPTIKKEK